MALKRPQDRKPLPRWMWWIAGFFLFAVVSFLVYLFISEGAGRAQWDQFRAEWEAKGEVFEWAAFIPPPIPDEENLAMAPVMQDLSAIKAAQFQLIPGFKYSKQLDWSDGKGINFTALFPGLSIGEAAKTIANAMEERADLLEKVTTATRERSKCRFPFDYELAVGFDITPVHPVRTLQALCQRRSCWHRSQGKINQSFDDWITGIHLVNAMGTAPGQLGFMLHRSLFHNNLQSIWELLHDHQLEESQLKEALTTLSDQHFIVRALKQIRIDRAMVLHWIDLRILGDQRLAQSLGVNDPFLNHYPKGWWYEDKRTFCDHQNRAFLYPNGVKATDTLDIAHCRNVESTIAQEIRQDVIARILPKGFSTNMAAAQITSFASGALHAETELRQLRTALALEQHYQKHQRFPQTLEDLVPDYLAAVPLDPIDQLALRYKPQPDRKGYFLYGIGSDSIDEGGMKGEGFEGDWVWPMPSE